VRLRGALGKRLKSSEKRLPLRGFLGNLR